MSTIFHNTMAALERSLHCELIASDLDLDAGVKSLEASDEEIREYATAPERQYSRIPLREDSRRKGTPPTHVAIVDVQQGRVVGRRRIEVEEVISGSTPVGKAITLLASRPFYFVLVPHEIRKILTVSDLNKLPVRTYLDTMLAHLEGLLADLIDTAFPQAGWLSGLSTERQGAIQDLHARKKEHDFDTRLIDCTTLADKATIIKKAEDLRCQLVTGSRVLFERAMKSINHLRARLAHGMPPLTEDCVALRDDLWHGQQLAGNRDVARLEEVVDTMESWIEALSSPETGAY